MAPPSLDEINPGLDQIIPKPKIDLLPLDVEKGLSIVRSILSTSADEICSRSYLLSKFYEYGLPELKPDFFKPWAKYMNKSGFGALQVPTEYIDCLRKLMTLGIDTGIEIGVYRGGFSYFTAAVLQRVRPNFNLTLVDPWDSMLGYSEFSKILNLTKAMPATSDDFAGQSFDFVFIDGDHSFEGAMRDFRNVGVYAKKALGFHDIHDHSADAGTVPCWNVIKSEMCETHEVYEFAHSTERGLGIGLVVDPTFVPRSVST